MPGGLGVHNNPLHCQQADKGGRALGQKHRRREVAGADDRGRGARPGIGSELSRRSFLGIAGTAVAGAALGACLPSHAGGGPHGSATVDLVYQDWRTPWFPGMAQEMLQKFHAAHPDLHVFYTPDPEALDEQMVADFQAGTAPDVLAGCCEFFPAWAQAAYLQDLRPYVAADLDQASIRDWDAAQYQALFVPTGLQFALPKYHGALALFFNKDLFDAVGVDYPDDSWTHDDYEAALSALTLDAGPGRDEPVWGGMIDISWERLQVHVNAWGGHFVDPDNPTRSLMAQPESLAALGWIRDRMWRDHTLASPLDVQNQSTRDAFAAGRLATVEEGSWALKDILEQATFRIGVAALPAGPARRATLATTDGLGIFAGTKHPEAAWELLKFLVSPEYGLAMARSHLLQPARASLVPEWIRLVQTQYPRQTQDLRLEAFAAGHLEGYSVTAEIFANMVEAHQLAREAWQRIFVLGQEPVSLMEEVSAQIERSQQLPETG